MHDFADLLRDYAIFGAKAFNKVPEDYRRRIEKSIEGKIERNERQIERLFHELKSGNIQLYFPFLPVPESGAKGFQRAFFVPRFSTPPQGGFHCAFCVVLWIDHTSEENRWGHTMAFRLEPADSGDSAHAYPHIQISKRVRSVGNQAGVVRTSLPEWIPDSYPAFPLPAESPMGFFASALASIHGYNKNYLGKFAPKVLSNVYSSTSKLSSVREIIKRLDQWAT